MKLQTPNIVRFILLGFVLASLSACATQPSQGMYWDRYEDTLYNLERDGDSRAQERHLATLRRIVDTSENRGWRVPPGVYLELAVMEQELGNLSAYADYVNRERVLYPESRPFIERWFADVRPPEPEPTDEPEVSEGEL
ncbi:DUF4810 domain-containing protein [Aliidiomarina minuta]|uniref:DUF4810 domain-containing protein n=1 Tax=Aliidiomarina minuta TaxID=880057 RepID=A0A432W9J4_9GAMM|nr:DUF4810 domain-containing protein [Aliidiomarina minuta]RUO26794.1 DUF4810 domain-containing protein [Aliidiomarina minuta]